MISTLSEWYMQSSNIHSVGHSVAAGTIAGQTGFVTREGEEYVLMKL